jgi:hypothetical protein
MAHARVLFISHLLATGAGYALAPRELLETEVGSRRERCTRVRGTAYGRRYGSRPAGRSLPPLGV